MDKTDRVLTVKKKVFKGPGVVLVFCFVLDLGLGMV